MFLELVGDLMSSPWLYAALLGIAALDGFFPVVPAETLVVTAGVFAAQGGPDLVGVIAAATVGACVGDHVSYLLGRGAGAGRLSRLRPGSRRRSAFDAASRALAERGVLALIVARYVPGGRTAVTLTMGAVRYPLRSFSFFAVVAAAAWGLYSALVGFVGGAAFEEKPLAGVLLGIGLALAVTVVVEAVRYRHRQSTKAIAPPPDAGGTLSAHQHEGASH